MRLLINLWRSVEAQVVGNNMLAVEDFFGIAVSEGGVVRAEADLTWTDKSVDDTTKGNDILKAEQNQE